MKCIVVSALAVAVTLAGWSPGSAKDEDYVKVEIKGRFDLYGSIPGNVYPIVVSDKQTFVLDLTSPAGKAISEKQLKELDNNFVIVQGKLVLNPGGANPSVEVTKLTLVPVKSGK